MSYNRIMHLILTHEQADFDAIAAMLGANLMHERALAVLPRRMNRNVRAFLTLYGAELPFVEIDDLPHEPVETVTLVDTQALVTLRGMNKKTTVQVVDHHTRRPDLPAAWNVTLDQTGACTTLFVEGIREHNDTLNPVYATLLLLGIYEDTGSLSYAGTTARDARAVGHLLEQGADLQIANHYLNPLMMEIESEPDELVATRVRYFRALRLLNLTPQHSLETLQVIQGDHVNRPDSICNHAVHEIDPMDREKTITALLFDLTERRLLACWGNPCENQYHEYSL